MIEINAIQQQLDDVEKNLDNGVYRTGQWHKFLKQAEDLTLSERRRISSDVTRVSNKLHRLNGFTELPAAAGFIIEATLFLLACFLMDMAETYLRLFAVVAFASCLQPGIKILVGILLGIRYSYVYLWYVEPRFKMAYGSYLARPNWTRVMFQFAGSLGTPIALYLGFIILADVRWLSYLSLAGCLAAAFMQVAAFFAYLFGLRKVGPFVLSNLTTPATLAKELSMMSRSRQ